MSAKSISYTRPFMTNYQKEIMDCPERFACVEASTKAGKTACMIVWLFEQALQCKINQSVFWVAPVFTQSKIAFDRMKAQVSDRSFFKVNETRLTLTMPHGSIIEFKSADNPDTLYGNDCYAAVLDEASRMKEDSWNAIFSTLTATAGKAKLIGNVKGRKNFFYKMCASAKSGEPGFFYKKITAYMAVDAGILDIKEINEAKAIMPENVFRENFLAEPSEDGGNPFGINHIDRATYPISPLPAVCYGIDLAKGRHKDGDWTVITGLDKSGQVCYFNRFQKDWQQTTAEILSLPKGIICIDATGVGDGVAEPITRVRETEPFVFTEKSKQMLMESLAAAIQRREVTVLDGVMKDELQAFEFEYTRTGVKYTAGGRHDDCVCSLALAHRVHRTALLSGDGPSIW